MKAAVVHVTPGRVAQEVSSPMPSHLTPHQRFWAKVDKNGPVPEYAPHLGPCWLWTGTVTPRGYGQLWHDKQKLLAHRWAYEAEYGSIPAGLECDHLCRIPACVRATHLEAVTHRENMRRGEYANRTHCPRGHPYTEQNRLRSRNNGLLCRECHRVWAARYRKARKGN